MKFELLGFAVFCGLIGGLGLFLRTKYDKFEFENRTDGGVVAHESYGKARMHGLKKLIARGMSYALLPCGLFVVLFFAQGK
jgi:hypothetical protein